VDVAAARAPPAAGLRRGQMLGLPDVQVEHGGGGHRDPAAESLALAPQHVRIENT
jgi:hypothetical protein